MGTESVPKIQSGGDGGNPKGEQLPACAAVLQDHAAVVRAAGEESPAQSIRRWPSGRSRRTTPPDRRSRGTAARTAARITSGSTQPQTAPPQATNSGCGLAAKSVREKPKRRKMNADELRPAEPAVPHVAPFVQRHHQQPGEAGRRDDQQCLKAAIQREFQDRIWKVVVGTWVFGLGTWILGLRINDRS